MAARRLMPDATFADLSIAELSYVAGRIRSEVMGRMMEDVVLLETRATHSREIPPRPSHRQGVRQGCGPP